MPTGVLIAPHPLGFGHWSPPLLFRRLLLLFFLRLLLGQPRRLPSSLHPERVNDFETERGLISGAGTPAAESRRDHGNRFAFPTAPWNTLRVSHTSPQQGVIIMQPVPLLLLSAG